MFLPPEAVYNSTGWYNINSGLRTKLFVLMGLGAFEMELRLPLTKFLYLYYFSIKQFNNPISPGNTGNDPRR